MTDKKGQVSVEFLLIFSFILLFLITFTLPLSDLVFKNNLEMENVLLTKNELSKIGNGINQVYIQGEGSKKTIILNLKEKNNIKIENKEISTEILLYGGNSKIVQIKISAENIDENLILNKGINKIEIYWPLNSENILINNIIYNFSIILP